MSQKSETEELEQELLRKLKRLTERTEKCPQCGSTHFWKDVRCEGPSHFKQDIVCFRQHVTPHYSSEVGKSIRLKYSLAKSRSNGNSLFLRIWLSSRSRASRKVCSTPQPSLDP